jgi:hypothetical protein
MKRKFSRYLFEKYININFHENSSGGSRVVQCGQKDGWSDMTKLIVVFRNFANAPKKQKNSYRQNARRKVYDTFV